MIILNFISILSRPSDIRCSNLSCIFIGVMFCSCSDCRFIRREKEIAETRFEVAQVESLRYRQRVEHLERELQELQDSLNAEREKVQVWLNVIAYDFNKRGLFSVFYSLYLLPVPNNEVLELLNWGCHIAKSEDPVLSAIKQCGNSTVT